MGTEQSSPANGPSKEEQEVIRSVRVTGERGRYIEEKKLIETSNENHEETSFIKINRFEDSVIHNLTESESDYSSDESDDEDEEYEEDTERSLIFEDIKNLRLSAKAFHHPETSIRVDAVASARCYFDRYSAPVKESHETSDYKVFLLDDVYALKKLAVDYAHPEIAVSTTDASVSARNYFSRPSAPTNEDDGSDERVQILADAAALKKFAVDYAHPEIAVSTTDASVSARNYFSRLSAFKEECDGVMEERELVMADAAALKKLAIAYAHPEHGVTTTDPAAFGRNYFNTLSLSKPLEVLDVPCPTEETKDVASVKTFDKQQPVSSKLSALNDGALGNVKRSPSSVILFGLGDDDGSAY